MNVIILAGGKGERLWPVSRSDVPKHFIEFFDGLTLFQATIKRALGIASPDQIYIVSQQIYKRQFSEQLRGIGLDAGDFRFVFEPEGRNTAPAVLLTALQITNDEPVFLMPCDHYISPIEAFAGQIKELCGFIENNREYKMAVIGIEPHFPSSAYGYIEFAGEDIAKAGDGGSVFKVLSFKEKPSRETAEGYLKKGNYLWNSGMLMFDKQAMINAFIRHQRNIFEAVSRFIGSNDSADYSACERISVDYAILEKHSPIAMIKAGFRWSDLGTWNALGDIKEADKDGNVVFGDCTFVNAKDNIVFAQDKGKVGIVGLDGVIVVKTHDATLVCSKTGAEDVRQIVDEEKARGTHLWRDPSWAQRSWGAYAVIDRGDGYKTKRIVVNPGAALSLQVHSRRSEHWVVIKGAAKVVRGEETFIVHSGESTFIPKGVRHKLMNADADNPLEIIEVQNGDYLEEDDIVRFE